MNNTGCEGCVGERRTACESVTEEYIGALAGSFLLHLSDNSNSSHAEYLISNAIAADEAFNAMRTAGCELGKEDFFDALSKRSLKYISREV